MRDRWKCVVAYFISLALSSLLAQEASKSDGESFDIEPPLLVKPWEQQSGPNDSGEDAIPLEGRLRPDWQNSSQSSLTANVHE